MLYLNLSGKIVAIHFSCEEIFFEEGNVEAGWGEKSPQSSFLPSGRSPQSSEMTL